MNQNSVADEEDEIDDLESSEMDVVDYFDLPEDERLEM